MVKIPASTGGGQAPGDRGEPKAPARLVHQGPPRPLDRLLRDAGGLSWGRARELVRSGKVTVDGVPEGTIDRLVRPGGVVELHMSAPRLGPGAGRTRRLGVADVTFCDAQLVVVRKPAGISTVPWQDEPGPTLDELVRTWLGSTRRGRGVAPLGVVHRLDKETSGLVVFARTWVAKKSLSSQFRFHTVWRRYFGIAHGEVRAQTFRSELLDNRGDGLRGSARRGQRGGRPSVTHVDVLQALRGATFVACRLETGRTHQIRIHLSEAGHPLVGERVYVRHFGGPTIPAPRLMLHAAELGFVHPVSGETVRFEQPIPEDMAKLLAELRGPRRP